MFFLSSLVHLQSAAPCVSDHDFSKLVTISPLFKTLQDIHQSLQNLTATGPSQHLHNGTDALLKVFSAVSRILERQN